MSHALGIDRAKQKITFNLNAPFNGGKLLEPELHSHGLCPR